MLAVSPLSSEQEPVIPTDREGFISSSLEEHYLWTEWGLWSPYTGMRASWIARTHESVPALSARFRFTQDEESYTGGEGLRRVGDLEHYLVWVLCNAAAQNPSDASEIERTVKLLGLVAAAGYAGDRMTYGRKMYWTLFADIDSNEGREFKERVNWEEVPMGPGSSASG
ncbi:unknown [Curvularia thermal tolerance virus]|uniref:Uncharacterized protein n=1 Tax=Curvularia thermal tolerance virus TaxID=421976 RepID=A3EYB0_9VIRU|nr:hypothetical protein CThTV_RNA2gp2 [Curvularia thermal tolerance virus]ABM92661.1 unknown [Curvularia thermal tolerance virus]